MASPSADGPIADVVVPRPDEWPGRLLEVTALESAGWRPEPFRQFVLKVQSRCNLACTYCYMYELADQSWRLRPTTMSEETVATAGRRIAEHVATHRLAAVHIVLHGGEPLMMGRDRLAGAVRTLRAQIPGGVDVRVTAQTNAVLLDEQMLACLSDAAVDLSVSLDGPTAAHDRRRRGAGGRGSHAAVDAALRLLTSPRYRSRFAGLLCVVDLENDPLEVYDALLAYAPPVIDFLLPHGTWTAPPPGRPPDGSSPYADWLLPVFDRWYEAPRRETSIRLFEEIIHLLLGGRSATESVGLTPSTVIVIETDGAVEQVDALKAAYEGAAATGLSLARHSFDAAMTHPSTIARQIGLAALAPTCLGCEARDVCGGGYYPHRYLAGEGFRNPSVYCSDLLRLIRHIAGRVHADLSRLSGRGP
jgi:uncharacterized protein